jgi:predicted signal transduction protein with EAL and GGDEF domain
MIHLPHDDAIEHVINRADEAMYMAKQAGRNRTATYSGKNPGTETLSGTVVNPKLARFHPASSTPQAH